MKRVLLTGGTGFVGANLARRLLREGHEVHLLVRPSSRFWRIEEIRERLRIHGAALANREEVQGLVSEIRPHWVFHLAAFGAYSSQRDIDEMLQTNLHGIIHLVDAVERTGIEALIHAGSSSEYGYKDHPPREDELLEPNSDYAVTKAAATQYCCHVSRSRRLPIVTLRLYSVYGPYEEPSRLIPTLIRFGLEGRLPPLVRPTVARDFVYVEDVCDAFLRAAAQPLRGGLGSIYNVGTGVQTSMQDVVKVARRALPIRQEPNWESMPDRMWDTESWVANPGRIRETLGWRPGHDFESGFRETLAWSQARGSPKP